MVIDINEDLTVYVHPLTIEQNLLAQRVFKRVYEEALLSGVFARKEMHELMIEEGVWSQELETELEKSQKEIENLKLSLYKSFYRPAVREDIRKKIREAEKQQLKYYKDKHENDHLDCEGIATYSRMSWIIENTTTYKDGTPYSFEEAGISHILNLQSEQAIEVGEYRELARTDPWRGIWINSSQDPERAFKRSVTELTTQQLQLISWSRLYDSIAEAHESPPEPVVSDDDALDGWLIEKGREKEREQNKLKLDGFDEKHAGADDVFVQVHSPEEAQQVQSMNDSIGALTVQSRKQAMEESPDGVKYHNFRDMKAKALNAANEKFG